MCNRSSDRISFVQVYDNALIRVKKAVNVDKDFRVTMQVNGQKLSPSHDIWRYDREPRVSHTSRALEHILKVVDSYSVCVGNPNRQLQDLVPMGSFLDSKEGYARKGYRTMYTGESTIVTSSCQLLVHNQRCKKCQNYRRALRSSLKMRDGCPVSTPDTYWLKSRIPNKLSSDNQKFYNLKQYDIYTKTLKKENFVFKRKLLLFERPWSKDGADKMFKMGSEGDSILICRTNTKVTALDKRRKSRQEK